MAAALTVGVLIVSIGSDRRQMLFDCIASYRRHNKDLPIKVISDVPLDTDFDWVRPESGKGSRFYKTQALSFSPYDITLLVDDDTVCHHPLQELPGVLAGNPAALCPDGWWETVGEALQKGIRDKWCSPEEAQATAAVCPGDMRHFNSGVFLFDKSQAAVDLFATWYEEWLRFQDVDQLALCRALSRTKTPITVLPKEWNCRRETPDAPKDPLIFHFTHHKARAFQWYADNHYPHAGSHQIYQAYAHAVSNGLCARHQYEAAGKIISDLAPAEGQAGLRLLIFGCGHDSLFWKQLNAGGRTLFVEDNLDYARKAAGHGCEVQKIIYPTKRGVAAAADIPAPAFISEPWDVILIDGPEGGGPDTPGRELPFRWTSQITSRRVVIAHDCERAWEKWCYQKYLGEPSSFLWGKKPHEGTMAFWTAGPANIEPLLR
jgi:hypothetical protein